MNILHRRPFLGAIWLILDGVSVPAGFHPSYCDVNRGTWFDLKALLCKHVGIGNQWLLEPHHLHQNFLPVLIIVLFLALIDSFLIVRLQLFIDISSRANIIIFSAL